MTRPLLPRYFVSRGDAQDIGSPISEAPLTHVIDSFFIGSRHLEEREWLVSTDLLGSLLAIPGEKWSSLPASVQSELAYHELSRNSKGRLLEVSEVFLFNLQLLEQPPGGPGLNDPVYLYGTLYGPYPGAAPSQQLGIDGQLTVTRGDVLAGLVQGSPQAFRYAKSTDKDGPVLRCLHLMLPGGTDEDTRRGSSIILAYPLLPVELTEADVSNEFVASKLLYDLLGALKEDLARDQIPSPLQSMVLPVPNRFMLEQELQTQGYSIEGNTAVRKSGSGKGFQGFLSSVFGALMNDSLELPPEGEVDQFLEIARVTLNSLPGGPPARTLALRDCLKPGPTSRGVSSLRAPSLSAANPPLVARTPQRPRRVESHEPPAWMQDFIGAHRRPDSPPSRLTSTSGQTLAVSSVSAVSTVSRKKAKSPTEDPDWMEDFKKETNSGATGNRKTKKKSSKKPKWMEDFE